jgi:hypothetical protein
LGVRRNAPVGDYERKTLVCYYARAGAHVQHGHKKHAAQVLDVFLNPVGFGTRPAISQAKAL